VNNKPYKGDEFLPPGHIKSRYAEKPVNDRFYGYVNVSEIKSQFWPEILTGSIDGDIDYLKRCIDHYKDRNPWMLKKHLASLLVAMEKKIRRDYCE
jgi:hypothetical protein